MTRISVQDLKANLSAAISEAESGQTLVVTRHNEPVAHLGPARPARVHRGALVGTDRLRPAIKGSIKGPKGRYLAVLADDRGTR